jgi:hypothetical protein
MTEELSPEAAALLEAARRNHGPTEGDRQRVLGTLHRSLGIGLPAALATSSSAGVSGGMQAAASGASLSTHPVAASVSGAASGAALPAASTSGAASAAGAHVATAVAHGASQVAPSASQAGLSLLGKLLTWKAGKLLLAGAALGSAVGIGASVAPRPLPPGSELADKSGSATAYATASSDAGSSSSPAAPAQPEPSERDPSDVAVAAVPAAGESLRASDDEVAPSLPLSVPGLRAAPDHASVPRAAAGSARRQHKHDRRVASRTTSRPQVAARDHEAHAVAQPPAEQDEPSAARPAPAVEVEAPHELVLIRRALTSLRDGEPIRALAQLDEHAARYPSGSFSTERRGLRVVALCEAGRGDEGERERAAFLKSAAGSPIAARVRSACAERDD